MEAIKDHESRQHQWQMTLKLLRHPMACVAELLPTSAADQGELQELDLPSEKPSLPIVVVCY